MSSGAPLLATTGGAIPEVVGDEGAAHLVPPNDPGALAAAILDLLGDPEARRQLSERGRERVLRGYTWRATAEGSLSEYLEELGC
jgi:glycosyltransferase involved in cell wall biosynthesis